MNVRIILGHIYDNYASALAALNIKNLAERRQTLLCKFGNQVLNSTKFRPMLPSRKRNSRQLRSSSISALQIPACRTDRYKKSTIPTLARILP